MLANGGWHRRRHWLFYVACCQSGLAGYSRPKTRPAGSLADKIRKSIVDHCYVSRGGSYDDFGRECREVEGRRDNNFYTNGTVAGCHRYESPGDRVALAPPGR